MLDETPLDFDFGESLPIIVIHVLVVTNMEVSMISSVIQASPLVPIHEKPLALQKHSASIPCLSLSSSGDNMFRGYDDVYHGIGPYRQSAINLQSIDDRRKYLFFLFFSFTDNLRSPLTRAVQAPPISLAPSYPLLDRWSLCPATLHTLGQSMTPIRLGSADERSDRIYGANCLTKVQG